MKLVRCSYPNCVLEEHLEGEHKLGRPDKPWGTLRQLQTFDAVLTSGGFVRCDYCTSGRLILRDDSKPPVWRAVGFYADMLGFGWALCAECAKTFATTGGAEDYGEKQKVAAHRAAASAAGKGQAEKPASGPQSQQATPKRPEDSGQALTPSVATFAVETPGKVLAFAPRAKSQKLKAGIS